MLVHIFEKNISVTDLVKSSNGPSCTGYECLKEYVDKPDGNYGWEDTGIRMQGLDPLHLKRWTGYVLNFTSQQWLTPEDSTRPIWWHILVIIIPAEIEYPDIPFLFITDGDNNEDAIPTPLNQWLLIAADFAVSTNAVGAALFQAYNPCPAYIWVLDVSCLFTF